MCCQALTGVMQEPDREGSASEHGGSLEQVAGVGGNISQEPLSVSRCVTAVRE